MTLIFVGTDYRSAPTRTLELLERRADEVRKALIGSNSPLEGAVVLATCNRFEVYAETDQFHLSADFINSCIRAAAELDADGALDVLSVRHGTDLVEHAFGVTTGLESLVVGETEIVGQVKRSLEAAQTSGAATSELHALFQSAASVAKQVLTAGELGQSGRSIATVALDHAEGLLRNDGRNDAVLIGTGAFARVALAQMERRGITVRGVYSPSDRADEFARGHSLAALDSVEFRELLREVDIVFSASGNDGYALDANTARVAIEARHANHPLVIIDVALSRDIDPDIATLDGVTLIDLDALTRIVPPENSRAVEETRELVSHAVREFETRRRGRRSAPTVTSLRALVADRVDEEVSLVRARAGDAIAQEVERALRRVTNSLLHTPTVRGSVLAARGLDDDYRRAVHLLFGVNEGTDD